jgi:hypothetical protein
MDSDARPSPRRFVVDRAKQVVARYERAMMRGHEAPEVIPRRSGIAVDAGLVSLHIKQGRPEGAPPPHEPPLSSLSRRIGIGGHGLASARRTVILTLTLGSCQRRAQFFLARCAV